MKQNKIIIILIILSIFIFSDKSFANTDKFEMIVKYHKTPYSKKSTTKNNEKGITKLGYKKIKIDGVQEYYRILKDPNIEHIESDVKYKKVGSYTSINDNDWWVNRINLNKSWEITKGSEDIIIAVIDTGVDYNHPDLKDNLIPGKNYVNSGLIAQDDDGHGTAVAGVIAADGVNDIGIKGVAYNCKIMPLKALDNNGDGYAYDIADAIIYAVDNGARIINLSLGGGNSQIIEDAIKYAYNKGAIIIAAAGNSNSDVLYPAAYNEALAVGSTNTDNEKTWFSCFGKELSISAPGVNIKTLELNGDVKLENGTSFSTPIVSGAAALLLSINSDLTNDQVQWILESTSVDLGSEGFDESFGYGELDIYKALSTNVKYYDNYESKKYLKYFLDEIRLSGDNNIIDYMKECFKEDDVIKDNVSSGIYKLKDNIDKLLTNSITENLINKGIASDYDELYIKLKNSLHILIDMTKIDKMLLVNMLQYDNEEVIENLLSKYFIYNKNDDNDINESDELFNKTISGELGITRDKDLYKFNIKANTTIEFNIIDDIIITLDLYDDNNELLYRSNKNKFEYTFNNEGQYYLKLYNDDGRWSNNEYSLSMIEKNNPTILGKVILQGQNNNKDIKLIINNNIEKYADRYGNYLYNNLLFGDTNLKIIKDGYLNRDININLNKDINILNDMELKLGDFNNDNEINIFDIVKMSKNSDVSCLSNKYKPLFDYNKDGYVNKYDIKKVLYNYKINN